MCTDSLYPCSHCFEFESVAECAFEQEPIAGHTGILKVSQPVLPLKLTPGSMLPWQDQLGTVVQEALTKRAYALVNVAPLSVCLALHFALGCTLTCEYALSLP